MHGDVDVPPIISFSPSLTVAFKAAPVEGSSFEEEEEEDEEDRDTEETVMQCNLVSEHPEMKIKGEGMTRVSVARIDTQSNVNRPPVAPKREEEREVSGERSRWKIM